MIQGKSLLGIVAAMAVAFAGAAASAQLVENGSMTGPAGDNQVPPSWTIANLTPDTIEPGGIPFGTGSAGPGMPASPDGGTFAAAQAETGLDDNFAEAFEQTIDELMVGTLYKLSFYQANAGHITGTENRLDPGQWDVTFGAATQTSPAMAFDGQGLQQWMQVTMNFTATAEQQVLRFTAREELPGQQGLLGNGGTGMAVDGVKLEVVPEPTTVVMLGGLAVSMIVRRRLPRR